MTYCTRQDLVDRFGEREVILLTDRDGSTGMVVDEVLDRAIADAEAEIDGYLGGRYTVPLDPVPTSIRRVACDLARYYLHDQAPTDVVRQRYEDAVRFLRAVSRGEVTLGVSESGTPIRPSEGAEIGSDGRIFGRKGGGFL